MRPNRAAVALLCGALALLPGCGSSSGRRTIPTDQGNKLIRNIQAADRYSALKRCVSAHKKVNDARFVLGQFPSTVSRDVRQGLSDGLDRLDTLISSECQPQQSTHTQTTQTETTQSQTTPTVTSQTQTTPTQTTPTQTQTQTQTTTTQTGTSTTPTTPTTTTGNGGTPPPPAGQGNNG